MNFKQAGKELVRGNFGNAVKALHTSIVDPMTYTSTMAGSWFFGTQGKDYYFDYSGLSSAIKAFQECPPISAIINRKAQAYINGRTWVMIPGGKGKGKESQSTEAKKLRKLLSRPNPLQSWKQFEAQGYIYQQLFGYNVILPIKPAGFGNIDATSMWNIPPFLLDIEETKTIWYSDPKASIIQSIKLTYKGTTTPLDPADVWIMKDFTPSFNSLVLPESRIKALEMPVNNVIGALESRNVLINSRGPGYIISSNQSDDTGNIAIPKNEKENLDKEFKTRYGLLKGQVNAIITAANIKTETIGFSTKDLMLFEEIEADNMSICDAYCYPFPLLSNNKSNSLGGNNVDPYMAMLYQDGIVPEAENIYEQWNQFFKSADYNLDLQKDYNHIPALQGDDLKNAQARKSRNEGLQIEFFNNLITLNRWRELNGEDTVSGSEGGMYYYELIAKGWVFGKAGNTFSITDNPGNSQQNP